MRRVGAISCLTALLVRTRASRNAALSHLVSDDLVSASAGNPPKHDGRYNGAPFVADIRPDSISTGDTQLARERMLNKRIMPQRRPTLDAAAVDQRQAFHLSISCRESSVESTDQVQQNDHDDRDAC
jgi:hypothetical protein